MGYPLIMRADMIQVLALLTMERPESFSADDLRKKKVPHLSEPDQRLFRY